jgi:uncharacterized protein YqgQ
MRSIDDIVEEEELELERMLNEGIITDTEFTKCLNILHREARDEIFGRAEDAFNQVLDEEFGGW